MRLATRVAISLPLALAACSNNSENPYGPNGPPEVFANGSGSIHEADLRASIHGGTVELLFPITRIEGGAIPMTLTASLVDLSKKEEPVLAAATKQLFQDAERATQTLSLAGLPADLERPKTAAIVIDWSVDLPQGKLHGKKSLYAALGKLEVQLKGSTDIPESGSVPFRVIVRDPDTLAARAGASVEGLLEPSEDGQSPQQLFAGMTDEKGELVERLALPAGVDQGSLRVEVKDGDNEAWVRANVSVVHEKKLALSTDKTIYKPGQTIELRTLALNGTSKAPIANTDVVFEALDGKGNKVFKRTATTDAFGVASMKVPTDSQVNEGTWTLRANIDGARAERKLPVARYNLPKMKVVVATTREYAVPGDTVTGAIDVRYLFGLPVVNAQAALQMATQDGTVIATAGPLQTDADGHATFSITVPQGTGGSSLEDGGASIAISAQITDSAGQQEAGETALPLSSGALVIKALPEAGALVPGIENIVYLLVGDPTGRPLVATLNVEGIGPLAPLTTDADGVAELRFTPHADATNAALDITATDGANRSHHRTLSLDAKSDGAVVIRTDKAVYEAGETATVRVLASGKIARVYLDVYKGAQGLDSHTLDLADGSAEALIPITEEMKGVLMLDGFALAGSGTVVRGSNRVLVDPQDRLDITLAAGSAQYAPGEDASVEVTVKDAAGAPQVASLGLTAVDEAVFALGGEPDDDLRTFIDLDRRILPTELRVLGRSPAELFSARDLASQERFARLLFASAKNVAAPGVDYNSVREELPVVRSSITSAVQRDVVRFLKTLIPAAHAIAQAGQGFTEDDAHRIVEGPAKRVVDMFGQLYQAKLGDNGNWYLLTMTSAGPDESFGTPDDVSVDAYYYWIQWADASQVTDDGTWLNGGFGGGGFEEGDAAAGGPPRGGVPAPPPQAPNASADHMSPGGTSGGGVKVRSDFRETVYVNPTVITDSSGRATVSFPLAQSITTWRVSAQGSTQNGKLGSARLGFRTFQEFFVDFDVPTTLTMGDTIELPAVVYNYLSTPATVNVVLDPAPWMTILSGGTQSLTLGPSEVRSVKFTVRADHAGDFQLSLHGSAGTVNDALVRDAHVMPNGVPEDQSFSDKLNGTREHTISVPADAIEGGTRVVLTLTPGFASEAVSGTEALLKEPNGCFEQTTSTAWPNTLVTTYLDITGQLTPDLRERAIDLVTRGYQRLLTFESPTGGYNWWGNSDPGNRILSAIMLWHLKDMEKIIETDPAVRDRTLAWLLAQQRADGSWESGDALHAGDEVLSTSDIRTTAFIAWALAHTGWADQAVERAAGWLRANQPDATDLYANALAANALAMADPAGATTSALFARLDTLKQNGAAAGQLKWPTDTPSWTGTGGDVAAIETTGLVAYGLLKANAYPENAAGAVRFIVANKDAVGSWYNTQATMNALRALLAAASPRGSDAEGTLSVTVNGQAVAPVSITAAEGDVYRELDLTGLVHAGDNMVSINMAGTGELSYHLSRRAYRPRQGGTGTAPFALAVSYDHASGTVGQVVSANVTATYTGAGVRDQLMVRVGRAPGFAPRTEELDQIVAGGRAARYEVNERDVTFYLMNMQSNAARDLSFHFTPTLAVTGEAPASVMYAYYEPALRVELAPIAVAVTGD